jgi:hypothetical protein
MRAPDIQFAAALRVQRMLGIALLVLGAAVAVAGVWQYVAALRELVRIDADIRAATGAAERERAAGRARAAPQMPEAKINAINSAIARLNVPWNEVFAAFETERTKEVGLLALLPDPRRRMLVVHAETLTARAMIDFVDRVRAVPAFSEAVLVKHERREQDPGQPYRFAVEVHWKEER